MKTCTRNRLTGYCWGWGGGGWGGCVLKIGFRNRQFGYSFEGKDENVCLESSDWLLLVRKGGHNVLQESSDWLPFWSNDKRCCQNRLIGYCVGQ